MRTRTRSPVPVHITRLNEIRVYRTDPDRKRSIRFKPVNILDDIDERCQQRLCGFVGV